MTAPGGEAARKSIHVGASLVAALVVWRLPAIPAATVLASAAAIALVTEVLRRSSRRFADAFQATLGSMLRGRERGGLTGATTLALGYTIAAVALPGRAAMAGILFTGVADALAAVVGRHWGRRRYPGGKSVEGSVAFLVSAALIAWALGAPPGVALAAAVALTLLEALTLPVDDNLYLPVVGAALFRAITGL